MNIRPYQGSDITNVLTVWNAAMFRDSVSEQRFVEKVLLDPNFQAANLPVAEVDGRVVGFIVAITRRVPFFRDGLQPEQAWITAFGVHPDYQHQGIGSALFTHIIDQLAHQGVKYLSISPYVPNYFVPGIDMAAYPNTITFLENHFDFKTVEQAISMGADLTAFTIPPDILQLEQRLEHEAAITICPVSASDVSDVLSFIEGNFGWDWYRHARDYLLDYLGGYKTTTICFLVARRQGKVIGFCQQRDERFGPFGVHSDQRGLGIGRVLLFRCLAMMQARLVSYAYFLWTEEEAARLYARAGFQRRREFAIAQKDLVV